MNIKKIIEEAYFETLTEMGGNYGGMQPNFHKTPRPRLSERIAIEDADEMVVQSVAKKYGPTDDRDFFSDNYDTYYKYIPSKEGDETGGIEHKLIKLPSFDKFFNDLSAAVSQIGTLSKNPEVNKNQKISDLFEIIKKAFRKTQFVLRSEFPAEYEIMKRKRALNELNYSFYTKPKHFDICPGAEALRKELLQDGNTPEDLGEWTFKHDELFKLEKKVLKSKKADDKDIETAENLRSEIINLSRDLGIDSGKIHYLKGHVDKIKDVANGVLSEGEGDDHHYIKVPGREFKKAMSILDGATDGNFVKMDFVDNDGAGNVIIYFMFSDGYIASGQADAFMYDAVMDLRSQGVNVVDHSAEDLVNEKVDINDPYRVKLRVSKMRADDMKKLDAYKKSPEGKAAARAQASAERKEEKARELVRKLKIKRAEVERDMENDPNTEPTGGPVADMYGDELNKIDNAIEKAASVYNKPMDYDTAVGKINEFVGKELEDRNDALYDKLVPGSGTSDTVEGEMLRAINRIAYRYYNDGDEYYRGYGTETAGPAHSFLVNANHPLKAAMIKIFRDGTDYEKTIKDALDTILTYIESKQGKYTKNNLGDIFNYEPEFEDDEEDYDDYDYDDDDYYYEGINEEVENEGAELPDATDEMLQKFPTLKKTIVRLMTDDFKEFMDTIDYISPRPTAFKINLVNGQSFTLKWMGKGFEATILGKRYYLDQLSNFQQALDKLSILYKEGPVSGDKEQELGAEPSDDFGGDTGGGGFDSEPTGAETATEPGGEEADLGGEEIGFEEPGEDPGA